MYDYLVVGAGLYGAVFAHRMKHAGRTVLLIERRSCLGGNVHSSLRDGIMVHDHGPHIFHTQSKRVWDFVKSLCEFHPYRHRVRARHGDRVYTLPFCLATFYEMWGCTTPQEAIRHLTAQRVPIERPANLEEQALASVGVDLYHTLIYGYTKKQWGREPRELPAAIIRRIPIRLTFDADYFNDRHQGIPEKGYTHLVEQMVDGVDIEFGEEFDFQTWQKRARNLVYSGSLDDLFDHRYGPLEYRGLRFEHERVEHDYQGCAQMNYTYADVPYTRIVEHKHFVPHAVEHSIITREYPETWEPGKPRYYPVADDENRALYERYRQLLPPEVRVGGRLGTYQYMDMDTTIGQALVHADRELA